MTESSSGKSGIRPLLTNGKTRLLNLFGTKKDFKGV